MATPMDLSEWDKDPKLYLFTSLTAGSSHIITATSRLETILKANRVPFLAIDIATNDQARRLWGRRAGKKKLPGLVKEGYVIGDLEEVEEWNEYGELKENIGPLPAAASTAPLVTQSASAAAPAKATEDGTKGIQTSLNNLNMKEAAAQAASIGAARKGPAPTINDTKTAPSSLAEADAATKPETMNSSAAAKTESIRTAEDTATLAANSDTVPISAVESNDSLATTVPPPPASTQQKHRGSSVSMASAEEIKALEQSFAIPEENEDEADTKTQAQETAAADKAAVSVED